MEAEEEDDTGHLASEFGTGSPASPVIVLGRIVQLIISIGVTFVTIIFVSEFTFPGFIVLVIPFIAIAWAAPIVRTAFMSNSVSDRGLAEIWASTIDGIVMIYFSMLTGYSLALISGEVRRHPVSVLTLCTYFFILIFVGFALVHQMRASISRIFGGK